MLRKDEPICVTRARHGIVVHHGLAALPSDWTLAPAPTQFFRDAVPQSFRQLCPSPEPANNCHETMLDDTFFDWDGMRVRMDF